MPSPHLEEEAHTLPAGHQKRESLGGPPGPPSCGQPHTQRRDATKGARITLRASERLPHSRDLFLVTKGAQMGWRLRGTRAGPTCTGPAWQGPPDSVDRPAPAGPARGHPGLSHTEAGWPECPTRTRGSCFQFPLTGHVGQVTVQIQLCQPSSALTSHLRQHRLQVGEVSGVDADLETPTGWTNVCSLGHAQRTRVGHGTIGRRLP